MSYFLLTPLNIHIYTYIYFISDMKSIAVLNIYYDYRLFTCKKRTRNAYDDNDDGFIPTKVSLPALQVQVELAHVPRPEHDGCPGHTCDDISAKI